MLAGPPEPPAPTYISNAASGIHLSVPVLFGTKYPSPPTPPIEVLASYRYPCCPALPKTTVPAAPAVIFPLFVAPEPPLPAYPKALPPAPVTPSTTKQSAPS